MLYSSKNFEATGEIREPVKDEYYMGILHGSPVHKNDGANHLYDDIGDWGKRRVILRKLPTYTVELTEAEYIFQKDSMYATNRAIAAKAVRNG